MSRLFTLSQGQSKIRFPDGFGIPITSDEAVKFDTMVLNMNSDAKDLKMKHKITVDFIRDRDAKGPLKPLFLIGGMGAKLLEGKDGYFGADPSVPMKHDGAGCSLGIHARDKDLSDAFGDGLGRKFTGRWMVQPGREESRTVQTKLWSVPFDTKIHYANVHLHPFAESLELRDVTTGQTVFKSRTRQVSKGIGLEHVDHFSSEEGLPFFKDHEYELITVYNNTTSEMQDAMSTLFLYVEDKQFRKPVLS